MIASNGPLSSWNRTFDRRRWRGDHDQSSRLPHLRRTGEGEVFRIFGQQTLGHLPRAAQIGKDLRQFAGNRDRRQPVGETGGVEGLAQACGQRGVTVDGAIEGCGTAGHRGVHAHGAVGSSCSPRSLPLTPYEMIIRSVIHSTGQRSSVQ